MGIAPKLIKLEFIIYLPKLKLGQSKKILLFLLFFTFFHIFPIQLIESGSYRAQAKAFWGGSIGGGDPP